MVPRTPTLDATRQAGPTAAELRRVIAQLDVLASASRLAADALRATNLENRAILDARGICQAEAAAIEAVLVAILQPALEAAEPSGPPEAPTAQATGR